jgi:long-subunit acyl-CoA synthetase (AMP-forming)
MATIESPTLTQPAATLELPTLCAAFQRTAAERGDALALRGGGAELSWTDYAAAVRQAAEGLHALGVRRGDTVALLLSNRPEFHVFDAAAMHLGAVPFSIYATSAPEQVEYVMRDSGARVAVTETALRERLAGAPEHVLVADEAPSLPRADGFDFESAWRAVDPDDLVTLIYTSGTTGPPKGVELSHRNVLAGWRGMHAAWGQPREPGRVISYLPTAHIADRFAHHYSAMLFGHSITCCPDPRGVAALLPQVRPTQFAAVPRVWQKIKSAVEGSLLAPPARLPEPVRAGIRATLGLDRCEVAVCAAAPVPREVLEFFDGLGVPICELYGLSETSAVATANSPGRIKIGTVGPPLPGVELRLAADGEVLLRGEMVMRGYRNRPDKTVEAIDADGWLHTGDVGMLDEDGYLRIVDRKKELIVNAAGKNMSPANIEATLKGASPLLAQACVIGDARPYNVALLTLDEEAAAAFAARHSVGAVEREVAAAVERANARLARVEQIKRYRVLDSDWPPGGAELTPTMKLKRRAIDELYADEIEGLYRSAS